MTRSNNNTIPVLYAADDNYSEVLGVSIQSLIENSHHDLKIYVIDQGISPENRKKLVSLAKADHSSISLIEMPDFEALAEAGMSLDVSRYSMSMYSRLLAGSLLPKSVERLLYLDCDTLVLDDMGELFNIDLGGRTIAAANDLRSWRYCRNLGLPKESCYVNSGVLVMNLERYRRLNYEKKFLEAMVLCNGLLEFPDNDLICMLMDGDIAPIPMRFNVFSLVFACEYEELRIARNPSRMPCKSEYAEALSNPGVVHFATCVFFENRPWNDSNNHPYRELYLRYREKTPWGNEPLRATQATWLKRMQTTVLKHLPRKLASRLFGLLHAMVKPNIQYFTKKRYTAPFGQKR